MAGVKKTDDRKCTETERMVNNEKETYKEGNIENEMKERRMDGVRRSL